MQWCFQSKSSIYFKYVIYLAYIHFTYLEVFSSFAITATLNISEKLKKVLSGDLLAILWMIKSTQFYLISSCDGKQPLHNWNWVYLLYRNLICNILQESGEYLFAENCKQATLWSQTPGGNLKTISWELSQHLALLTLTAEHFFLPGIGLLPCQKQKDVFFLKNKRDQCWVHACDAVCLK